MKVPHAAITGSMRPLIYRIRPRGGIFSDHYIVIGAIEGVCPIEAGYFEDGRRKEAIPIVTNRAFSRFEFELPIRRDRYPEIRVYNAAGERDIVPVDPDRAYGGRSYGDDRRAYDRYDPYDRNRCEPYYRR